MNSGYKWDIFISHASEDKDEVARPLAAMLEDAGLKVWFDERMILIGDQLREKIEEGLKESKYGVVIFSPNFFAKKWPKRELDGLFDLEESGEKRILPIWHNVDENEVREYSPILAGRKAALTVNGLESVAEEILKLFEDAKGQKIQVKEKNEWGDMDKYPEVEVKRQFSDKDRLDYLRKSFASITTYFEKGLRVLEKQNNDISTDFQKISPQEFHCIIFLQGRRRAECKIWIGRDFSEEDIKYSSSISLDNSWNESISVKSDDYNLYLEEMGMPLGIDAPSELNQNEAAKYLWGIFIKDL